MRPRKVRFAEAEVGFAVEQVGTVGIRVEDESAFEMGGGQNLLNIHPRGRASGGRGRVLALQ